MTGMEAVLAAHVATAASCSTGGMNVRSGHGRRCVCGVEVWVYFDELDDEETSTDAMLNAKFAAHVAQVLAEAGYGQLPEPIDPHKATIINGWLVVEYGSCTCGGGDEASGYHHEGGCGYEPLMNITDILAATGYTLTEGATP